MRLKLEVSTREHFAAYGLSSRAFTVANPWFSGTVEVTTYTISELLGKMLPALYQCKKGRDLFDLALGLNVLDLDTDQLVAAFESYMAFSGTRVTRAQFEANMADKMADATFLGDVPALLRTGLDYDPDAAWARVHDDIITKLPGEPWKGRPD